VWDDPKSTGTFVPGDLAPQTPTGIDMVDSFTAPKAADGWLNLSGQKPDTHVGLPDLVVSRGKSIGAGVCAKNRASQY
jgi:hypothetical protein